MAVQGGVVANPGTAIGIASAKTSLTFVQAFTRGILCNWLVCMAGTITGRGTVQGVVNLNLQLVLAVGIVPTDTEKGGGTGHARSTACQFHVAHVQPRVSTVEGNVNREWLWLALGHALFGVLTHKVAAPYHAIHDVTACKMASFSTFLLNP